MSTQTRACEEMHITSDATATHSNEMQQSNMV